MHRSELHGRTCCAYSHAHSLIALLKENCHDDQRFYVLIAVVYYPITSKKQYKILFIRVIEFFS